MGSWYTIVCMDDWCTTLMLFGYFHTKKEELWISLNSQVTDADSGRKFSQCWK